MRVTPSAGELAGERTGWSHEAGLHEGLGGQVVELGGACGTQHVDQRPLVEQVRLVQFDAIAQMGDALEAFGARAAHHAVHVVALLEQEFGQVGAVLARDAGDQRSVLVHEESLSASAGGGPGSSKKPRLRRKRTVSTITANRKTIAANPDSCVNDSAITQKQAVRK